MNRDDVVRVIRSAFKPTDELIDEIVWDRISKTEHPLSGRSQRKTATECAIDIGVNTVKYKLDSFAEKLANAIMALDKKEPKPEWEERADAVLANCGVPSVDGCEEIKDFIRQEFKQLALDFKRELLPERYYPDVKQHTRNQMWIDNAILEALHKRGVK